MSHPPKVLVVDDDDAIRAMVERVLRRERYDVECARDGHEAIEKLRRNDYGTVLLDLMMPRVDGMGVLRFLESERGAHPPVIVMTANTSGAADARRARPTRDVLPKPFDIRDLIQRVKACTESDERSAESA